MATQPKGLNTYNPYQQQHMQYEYGNTLSPEDHLNSTVNELGYHSLEGGYSSNEDTISLRDKIKDAGKERSKLEEKIQSLAHQLNLFSAQLNNLKQKEDILKRQLKIKENAEKQQRIIKQDARKQIIDLYNKPNKNHVQMPIQHMGYQPIRQEFQSPIIANQFRSFFAQCMVGLFNIGKLPEYSTRLLWEIKEIVDSSHRYRDLSSLNKLIEKRFKEENPILRGMHMMINQLSLLEKKEADAHTILEAIKRELRQLAENNEKEAPFFESCYALIVQHFGNR